ncbi:hypothetical protein FACS1894187_23190 [Synergistales bacterium]|nr:hypothetical protein FACS1894187_23190 [Synergistales bacterium]
MSLKNVCTKNMWIVLLILIGNLGVSSASDGAEVLLLGSGGITGNYYFAGYLESAYGGIRMD